MKIRKTAYTIIFITNIFLLVYAIVPHHHHHSQILLFSSHCQSDDFAEKHNHQNDNQNLPNNCVLTQTVILPSWNNKEDLIITYNTEHQFLYLPVAISEIISIKLNSEENPFPDILFTYSSFVHRSSGLRAPPVV